MATYGAIERWVWREYGFVIQPAWIAHVKELNGLPVRRAWNRQATGRLVACPPDKRPAIEAALRHFGMLEGDAP
jgi:hypothetical protein